MTDTTYTKVFIGGLRWETTAEKLREHFGQYGEIIDSNVVIDRQTNRSRGYGFVIYTSPEAAAKATADPFPTIDGRKANCNLAALGAKTKTPGAPQAGGPGYGGGYNPSGGYNAGGFHQGGYNAGGGNASGNYGGGYGYGQQQAYGQGYPSGYHAQPYGSYQQYMQQSQPFQGNSNLQGSAGYAQQQPSAGVSAQQDGYDNFSGNSFQSQFGESSQGYQQKK